MSADRVAQTKWRRLKCVRSPLADLTTTAKKTTATSTGVVWGAPRSGIESGSAATSATRRSAGTEDRSVDAGSRSAAAAALTTTLRRF
jgi:hypothetical protein